MGKAASGKKKKAAASPKLKPKSSPRLSPKSSPKLAPIPTKLKKRKARDEAKENENADGVVKKKTKSGKPNPEVSQDGQADMGVCDVADMQDISEETRKALESKNIKKTVRNSAEGFCTIVRRERCSWPCQNGMRKNLGICVASCRTDSRK